MPVMKAFDDFFGQVWKRLYGPITPVDETGAHEYGPEEASTAKNFANSIIDGATGVSEATRKKLDGRPLVSVKGVVVLAGAGLILALVAGAFVAGKVT